MSDSGFDGLPSLVGTIGAVILVDNGFNPNNVVDDDVAFDVKVTWKVGPAAVATVLDGKWTVDLYAESMGPGDEKKVGSIDVPATGASSYAATITVAPGSLHAEGAPAPDSGVYKLVEVLTYRTQNGVKTEIAAFSEGPMFLLRHP